MSIFPQMSNYGTVDVSEDFLVSFISKQFCSSKEQASHLVRIPQVKSVRLASFYPRKEVKVSCIVIIDYCSHTFPVLTAMLSRGNNVTACGSS